MEFHEKLQTLRKRKGLTQEELAGVLFVSRTAVSKWESGRGYPSIDSLKALSAFFGVSIDALLSGEELLTLAEEDTRQKGERFRDLVFGLLDVSLAAFFFLPLFGQQAGGTVRSVSLLSLTAVSPWLRRLYILLTAGTILWGVFTLALQGWRSPCRIPNRSRISMMLTAAGTLLFILTRQPYGAVFLFLFLAVKAALLAGKP